MKLKGIGALWGMVFGFGAGSVWIYGCEPACERTLTCGDVFGGGTVEDAGLGVDADAADAMDAMVTECYLGSGSTAAAACSIPCSTTNCAQCQMICVNGATPACSACTEGFDSYWPASAEHLASYLAGIPNGKLCDPTVIPIYEALVAEDACDPNGFADATCNQVLQLCDNKFTVATCLNALLPFRDKAHEAYINCMASLAPNGTSCDDGHPGCITQVRNLDLP